VVAVEVVRRSGHRVQMSPGFDTEQLLRVVATLESGC
jgi:hypothetical protein